MYSRKRRDSNHKSLVKTLRAFPGLRVVDIADFGNGIGDILLGYKGRNFLFEIKDPLKIPSKKRLTKGEQIFHELWPGQIETVETYEEILKAIDYNMVKP